MISLRQMSTAALTSDRYDSTDAERTLPGSAFQISAAAATGKVRLPSGQFEGRFAQQRNPGYSIFTAIRYTRMNNEYFSQKVLCFCHR